jgi:hypothetical protein
LSPLAVLEAVFTNLKPFGFLGIKLGAVLIATRSHISDLGSSVVWPLKQKEHSSITRENKSHDLMHYLHAGCGHPVESERATRFGSSARRSGLSTRTTVKGGAVGTIGRVDACHLADDGSGLGTFTGTRTVVPLSVDFQPINVTVGSSERSESEGDSGENGERLHC